MSQAFVTTTIWETVEFLQHKSATHIQIWAALFSFQYGRLPCLVKKNEKEENEVFLESVVVWKPWEAAAPREFCLPWTLWDRKWGSVDPPATPSGSWFAMGNFCWTDANTVEQEPALPGIWHSIYRWEIYLYEYTDIDFSQFLSLRICLKVFMHVNIKNLILKNSSRNKNCFWIFVTNFSYWQVSCLIQLWSFGSVKSAKQLACMGNLFRKDPKICV